MLQLIHEQEKKRTYRNTTTNSEFTTELKYKDESGNDWWVFTDLINIPYIRTKVSEKFTMMFNMTLGDVDIDKFVSMLEGEVKSNSANSLSNINAHIYNFKSLKKQASDVNLKNIALCSVYCLLNDENPAIWSEQKYSEKIGLFTYDLNLCAFFLNWLHDGMNNYIKLYNSISQTALMEKPNI